MAFDPVTHGPQFFPGSASAGVLVVHGFTSTTASVIDWAREIHLAHDAAGRHPSVSVPLLPGHGTTWQELSTQRWRAWRDAVTEEYWRLRRAHGHVVACGLSMGGALAVELAARYPVAGMILVNPALALTSRTAVLSPLLKYAVPSVAGIAGHINRPSVKEDAYDRTPVAAVAQLKMLVRHAVRTLPAVTAPALVFRSRVDRVVSGTSVEILRERSGGPVEVVGLPNSFHLATLDYDRDVLETASRQAVQSVVAGRGLLDAPEAWRAAS